MTLPPPVTRTPHMVHGGFLVVDGWWYLNRDEDWDYEYEVVEPTVWPTEAEAWARIEELRAQAPQQGETT